MSIENVNQSEAATEGRAHAEQSAEGAGFSDAQATTEFRFQLISIFQIIVPLCITLALWNLSPFIAVLFGFPTLLSVAAVVRFVWRETAAGRGVSFVQRMDIFTQAFAIVVLVSLIATIVAVLSYMTGHILGGPLGGVVVLAACEIPVMIKLFRHLFQLKLASAGLDRKPDPQSLPGTPSDIEKET